MATKISKTSPKGPLTMADLLAKVGHKLVSYSVGQKIRAKVVSKTHKALVLDIGGKSEGVVCEKAFIEARDYIKSLKVGDEVLTSVLIPEAKDGSVILSLRQAMYGAAWEKLEKAKSAKEGVAVYAKGVNPSGVAVECEGVNGFIPTTQLSKEALKNTQNLVGKYFKAVPIEVDRNYNKLVLSEKEVSEASDIKAAGEAISKIKEGDVYDGIVTTVANFGCFVKIELEKGREVEGLVHISELSWGRVERVTDVVNKEDKVKIKVIGKKDGKLAFSIKQALKDPWADAKEKYKQEAKVKGRVVRLSDFVVFVELEPVIEGLIHITKIPPATRIKEGDEVNCYVEEIDTKSKKLSLGLVLTSKPLGYK